MGMEYLETSAKDNTNVDTAFFTMARQIKERLSKNPGLSKDKGNMPASRISIEANDNNITSGCC